MRVCAEWDTVGSSSVPTSSSPLRANPAGVHSSRSAFKNEIQPLAPNSTRRFSPPGWKLSDTSSKAKRGESLVPLMPANVTFSSISFLLTGIFSSSSFPNTPGTLSSRMDAAREAEWGRLHRSPTVSLSLSLSPSLTRAVALPSPSFSLHLPTLSFSISSSPFLLLSQTHWDMHFSGFSQLLWCHCQPCQPGRFASQTPEGNKQLLLNM